MSATPTERTAPRLFGVVTWGNAGSMWLAKLLNAHPDIFCLHHLKGQWADILGQKRLDDRRYFRIIERQAGAYALAGDVHGVELPSLPVLAEVYGERFRAAVLVRHPLPRILSHLGSVAEKGRNYYRLNYRGLRRGLPPDLRDLLDGEERLFFVHIMNLVNRIALEQAAAPVFALEQLSEDRTAQERLLDHLSAGSLTFGDSVMGERWKRPINSRFPDTPARPPAQAYDALPEWSRTAFARLLDPAAREAYEALGYDFSFL